jgi:hypothetical protein
MTHTFDYEVNIWFTAELGFYDHLLRYKISKMQC